MAKCSDKERELLDRVIQCGYVPQDLHEQVLEEKTTKEMRNRLKYAFKHVYDAQTNL